MRPSHGRSLESNNQARQRRRAPDWLLYRDGRWRPVEPEAFPLADGVPDRMGLPRGDLRYRGHPAPDLRDRRRGDGRGDDLAKPTAGAMLSARLHGRDPGRHSRVSNAGRFVATAIPPDGIGGVLGLRFQANEGATVRAKGLDDPRNRSIQNIPIAVVGGLKGFPQIPRRPSHRPRSRPASGLPAPVHELCRL